MTTVVKPRYRPRTPSAASTPRAVATAPRSPAWLPSSAIWRVLITLSGYSAVVRPCSRGGG